MDNKSVKERTEERWRDILENGKLSKGISINVDPETPPVWYNQNKFNKSQELANKYYGSLQFGSFLGLLLVLYHAEGLAPLIVTGNSSNVQKLFRRYLSTMIHVKHWYSYDPFQHNSKSFKSLKHVRGLHRQVSQSMNTKDNRVEGKDRLWIPQYGMAHAQFAFIGFVALYPKECGLHSLSDQDFDCLLYFWRVIGYCLGTDDRFNLCSGTPEETVELCKLMFWREWYPLINAKVPACPAGEEMAKGICLAMNKVARFINWNVLMKYWYPILNISKTVELKSFSEYFWYYFIKTSMNFFTKFSFYHHFMSFMSRIQFSIATRLKNYKYKCLAKEYEDLSYDNKICPFDVNFNYVDAFETFKDNESTHL